MAAFATSYIPTVASQVTRNADVASMTGANFSSWFRADEGTMYSEAIFTNTVSFNTVFNITDGTSANRIRTMQWNNGTNRPLIIEASGASQTNLSGTGDIGSFKFSAAYKTNDFAASVNGEAALTDTSGIVPNVNQLLIGATVANTFVLNGHIRTLRYYPQRLSNSQLQAITS